MIESKQYSTSFFSEMEENSYRSAKVILPIVNDLLHPKSVIDVGCGTGVWLKVWDDLNVKDYLGIEGPYLKPEMLKVPVEKVEFKDLKQPFPASRKYDLAMSLEVAEHLPDSVAHQFIKHLTSLSDVVLFSAAIPHQQGTYHINEQYPEYWAKHFQKFGFVPADYLRPLIWNNPDIEYWYKQNCIVYINSEVLDKYPAALKETANHTEINFLTRIHPFLYELKNRHIKNTKSFFGFLNWKWYMFKTQFLKKKK